MRWQFGTAQFKGGAHGTAHRRRPQLRSTVTVVLPLLRLGVFGSADLGSCRAPIESSDSACHFRGLGKVSKKSNVRTPAETAWPDRGRPERIPAAALIDVG
jgi:hypothetical protein